MNKIIIAIGLLAATPAMADVWTDAHKFMQDHPAAGVARTPRSAYAAPSATQDPFRVEQPNFSVLAKKRAATAVPAPIAATQAPGTLSTLRTPIEKAATPAVTAADPTPQLTDLPVGKPNDR